MPAGKMVKYVPKRPKRSSGFRKAVTKIAKKTLMGNSETKQRIENANLPFGINGLMLPSNAANGLFNGIIQGTSSASRIGDRIKVTGVKLRYNVYIDPAVITAQRENCAVRLVIATNKQDQLTTGDMPTYMGVVDPEKVTVLYDKYIRLSSLQWNYPLSKYVKFNRIARFSGVQCIGKNLYVWMVPNNINQTGITTTTGWRCEGNAEILYKDV